VRERGDGWLAVSGPDAGQLRAMTALRATLPPHQYAVLKVALDAPDVAAADTVLQFARDGGWDEVTFEFGSWDLDGVLSVLDKRC
jgi:hypothetical protein